MTIGVVLIAAASQAQTCLHGPDESAYQRARRDAAIRFVQQVNDAENILRLKRGKFGHLDELSGIGSPPVGFVPKVTVDGWNYTIVVKDFFDDCGFTLFSDQDRVIYEGRPVVGSRGTITNRGVLQRPTAPARARR